MTTIRSVWAATALGVLLSSCAPGPGPGTPSAPLTPATDRGGIAGEAISLESPDPSVKDYLARVRDQIRSTWVFPCVTNPATQACEFKNARIRIEFGILKSGVVQYVELREPAGAGLEIYDRHAVEAIRRASPFPVMPPQVAATLKQGSTGMPVAARFNYVVDPSRPPRTSRAGIVRSLKGDVTAQRVGSPSPVPLKVNDDVFLQDTITTGDRARIDLVIGGKATLTMERRSSVTITEFPGRSTLDLHAGQLTMHVAGDRLRPGDEVHVKTPNAVAAVRGGVRLTVTTGPADRAGGAVVTEIDVLEGSTDVTFPARAPEPALRLRTRTGMTITGEVAGPTRPLRRASPPTK